MPTLIQNYQVEKDIELTVTLKPQAINLFEQPANNLWTFDREGRLVGMYIDGVNYRRTLDNRFFMKTRTIEKGEVFRHVTPVAPDRIKPYIRRARNYLQRIHSQLPPQFDDSVTRVLAMTGARLQREAHRFSQIYLPISILPPDQYLSLVVQLTEGCNYNQCLFCNFYRDRPFRIKPLSELKSHLQQIRAFFGEGLRLRKSIFLADANALVTPQRRLVAALDLIRRTFPELTRYYSFIDVFTGIKKGNREFNELYQRGLRRVYLGVESGHPELLAFLDKPQMTADIVRLATEIKAGGIALGLIFLVGAGGKEFVKAHRQDSLQLIRNLPLSSGDIIYLSEFHETNPAYRQRMDQHHLTPLTTGEIRSISNDFKTAVKKVVPKNVKVSIYDINQFFY
jgi:radical SAM superfamily enzyme YgiQ (UPF0313 family)